jgi:drug/metabolite transporter (DMT)-like permease
MTSRALAIPRNKRLLADLALFAAAVVWGSAFSAQRVAAAHLGPFLYNGVRFLLGVLVLLPLLRGRLRGITRLEWQGGILAGILVVAAAALQQGGLLFTTAGKAGFITGLYVVLVPLFLALAPVSSGWRQRPGWMAWAASGLAAAGLFLLSAAGSLSPSLGDGLELIGAALWALQVIVIGRFAHRVDPLRLALIQYLVCGVLSTLLGLGLESHTLGGLRVAWWAVLYGGLISVGVGYTLQVVGQKVAPATDAAILMSMEAVFAALFGWLTLGERLTPVQLLGCALMLAGMLSAQASAFQRAEPSSEAEVAPG